MRPDISVIIMAFNEKDTLKAVAAEIDSVLKDVGLSYEVVIIDDGSSDGTGAIADRLTQEFIHVRTIHHDDNKGLGGVYRTGFAEARGDFITFFPADGQFPADIIKGFIKVVVTSDMVLGYLPKRNDSLLSKSLSKAERWLLKFLFGQLPDFQGVMMFRRSLLDKIELKSKGRGWAVLMELIIRAHKAGYRIVSVPTQVRQRMSGRSKVNNPSTILANLGQAVTLSRYI